jgi:acyl-CoA thioester hydrolase
MADRVGICLVSERHVVIGDSGLVTGKSHAPPSDQSPITSHQSPSSASFNWPVRVYWEDTDAGGIVYYANYLKFMERARTEWLRAIGIEQRPLQEDEGLIFVICDTQVEFKKPARYGDALTVTARIDEHTRATLRFTQQVLRGGVEGELLVTGAIRVACLDAKSHRPRGLPKTLTENLLNGRS